jgi:hypothetical protein
MHPCDRSAPPAVASSSIRDQYSCPRSARPCLSIWLQYSSWRAIPATGGNVGRYTALLASARLRAAIFATVARLHPVAS